MVSDKDKGCLGYLLAFVQEGAVRYYYYYYYYLKSATNSAWLTLICQITVHTEIGPEDIDWDDEIGSGTAGSVYRGIWRSKNVAVKKFRGVAHEDFLKELSIMR